MRLDPESTYRLVKDDARRLTEERAQRHERAAVSSGHSRTGLMAAFLRRLADRIDPSGQNRLAL